MAKNSTKEKLKRIDKDKALHDKLLEHCRLSYGETWTDPVAGHKVGVIDATDLESVKKFFNGRQSSLLINDPPYNITVGSANTSQLFKIGTENYINFSKAWINSALNIMSKDAHFYVWLGADYRENFQPLPDFMILMRNFTELKPRNFITMRNQRGYGTQKNWMWVRQELLHYIKGNPYFNVVYTDIPKILKGGYYKVVKGEKKDTSQRSKSETIRPGNVWVDIQQVFYRMEENVPGCYAQKPLKAIIRIIESSLKQGDLISDFFAHSGTTLIAGELTGRKVYTFDIDPVFAEITIRRLEHFRKTGKTGWQWENPFPEIKE
jgi:DNA modification methylase